MPDIKVDDQFFTEIPLSGQVIGPGCLPGYGKGATIKIRSWLEIT